MTRLLMPGLVLSGLLALTGCGNEPTAHDVASAQKAAERAEAFARKKREDYEQLKKGFLEHTTKRLEQIDARIAEWEGRLKQAPAEQRPTMSKALADFRSQRADIQIGIEKLREAAEEDWAEQSKRVQKAIDDLEASFTSEARKASEK